MRRMFGKTGVFCDGLMFGMVTDDTLYFRVDDHNREAFSEAAAFPPLNYAKGGRTIDLAFWRAPERLWTNPTSSSPGREPHWRRRAGSRRSGDERSVGRIGEGVIFLSSTGYAFG